MKKIVIASDSFKDSLSSQEVADAFEKGVRDIIEECNIVKVPIADGGEGSVDALTTSLKGEYVYVEVNDPLGRRIKAKYAFIESKKTAIIEAAAACGLTLLNENERNPMLTSTFGVGEIIKDAINRGSKKLIIGIGGTSTNDAGTGMLQALGYNFYNIEGKPLNGNGKNLENISYFTDIKVNKSLKEIENKIKQEGERAAVDLGIMNLNKELSKTLGRLYYRTSYGQNVLKHSIEVGQIAGMLAAELGSDVKLAKRAGLLHDIGKAVDQEQEGTHVQLGADLARRYGEKEVVVHAIEAHHDDVAVNTLTDALVKIADTISAGRPGARRDTLEIYIKRLKKLEEIANSYEGIKQTFAVSAGREVRVIVQPSVFDDVASAKLARDIAKRIEDELEYPGQIRVTVVREARVTEIAK